MNTYSCCKFDWWKLKIQNLELKFVTLKLKILIKCITNDSAELKRK